MKNRIVLILALFVLPSCTNEDASRHTLQSQGFTDVQFHGYGFGCAKEDGTSTSFTARNPQGQSVSGVVCCPLIEHPFAKRCTVRW